MVITVGGIPDKDMKDTSPIPVYVINSSTDEDDKDMSKRTFASLDDTTKPKNAIIENKTYFSHTIPVENTHLQTFEANSSRTDTTSYSKMNLNVNSPIVSLNKGLHYSLQEFEDILMRVETVMDKSLRNIEKGPLVKRGNKVNSSNQTMAMYGRIMPAALEKIFDMLELQSDDIFIDVGHGIGVASLQAAYTRGCESRGIELINDRFVISEQIKDIMISITCNTENKESSAKYLNRGKVGEVSFIHGDFTKRIHSDYITTATKVLVNNCHGVFAHRSCKNGSAHLDDYIGTLFAMMKPGSIMVTLERIMILGRSNSEENEFRKSRGLKDGIDASFFEYEARSIGTDAVTWSSVKPITVYIYRRLAQSSEDGSSYFLCNSKKCANTPYPTAVIDPKRNDGENITLLENTCLYCNERRLATKRIEKRLGRKLEKKVKTIPSIKSKTKKSGNVKKSDEKKHTKNKKIRLKNMKSHESSEPKYNHDDSSSLDSWGNGEFRGVSFSSDSQRFGKNDVHKKPKREGRKEIKIASIHDYDDDSSSEKSLQKASIRYFQQSKYHLSNDILNAKINQNAGFTNQKIYETSSSEESKVSISKSSKIRHSRKKEQMIKNKSRNISKTEKEKQSISMSLPRFIEDDTVSKSSTSKSSKNCSCRFVRDDYIDLLSSDDNSDEHYMDFASYKNKLDSE